MPTLVSKDEPLQASTVYTGYLILKALKKSPNKSLTLAETGQVLRPNRVTHSRPLLFGLMFLYSAGLIEFTPPYFTCCDSND